MSNPCDICQRMLSTATYNRNEGKCWVCIKKENTTYRECPKCKTLTIETGFRGINCKKCYEYERIPCRRCNKLFTRKTLYTLKLGLCSKCSTLSERQMVVMLVNEPTNIEPIRYGRLQEGECRICLENFTEDSLVVVLPSCKHIFHSQCINSVLESPYPSCPLCRNSV